MAPVNPLCESVQVVLDLLSRPWTGLILAALQAEPLRFSQLSAQLPAIGDKVLSARLKQLEKEGLLVRQVEHGPPVKVRYRLTAQGRGFRKVMGAIDTWGRRLIKQVT